MKPGDGAPMSSNPDPDSSETRHGVQREFVRLSVSSFERKSYSCDQIR